MYYIQRQTILLSMFFCVDIGVDVDVDGNVAINVGKYLETNCWKWEASISRAQPPTVLSDFLHFCHWPESLLIKIEKFKRKRFTIIKLCLSLFVIVVIFVLTVFFTFAFYLILPQKWGLHIIMSSRQHWIIKVGALKMTWSLVHRSKYRNNIFRIVFFHFIYLDLSEEEKYSR